MSELLARAAAPSQDRKALSGLRPFLLRQRMGKASHQHSAEVFSAWKRSFCYSEQSVHTSQHKLL